MPVVTAFAISLIALFPPEAEDPLPDRVGPLASIAGAGVGAVLAGVIFVVASASRRESAVRWGALIGFVAGAVLYLLTLIASFFR